MNYPMTLLTQGDITGMILYVMGNYPYYAVFWIYMGILMFATVQDKTKSYAISGYLLLVFLSLVGTQLPPFVQPYFVLLIGIIGTALFVKIMT